MGLAIIVRLILISKRIVSTVRSENIFRNSIPGLVRFLTSRNDIKPQNFIIPIPSTRQVERFHIRKTPVDKTIRFYPGKTCIQYKLIFNQSRTESYRIFERTERTGTIIRWTYGSIFRALVFTLRLAPKAPP